MPAVSDGHGAALAEIDAEMWWCAVVFVVAEHGLEPSAFNCVPLAGLKYGLQFIKASRGSGPVTVAVPGQPAAAVYPQSESVQGCEQDQADSQARDGHKENQSHEGSTHGAFQAFRSGDQRGMGAALAAARGGSAAEP